MSSIGDSIQVYPLMENWSFNITQSGITGKRTYLECADGLTGVTAEALPTIGTKWDDDYPTCTCKSIDVTYVQNNENCGRKYVCSYDSSAFVQSEEIAADDLPINVMISGSHVAIEPFTNLDANNKKTNDITYYWNWDSDNAGVHQSIGKMFGICNIKFTRVVDDAANYVKRCLKYVGYVNEGVFFGFTSGMVLFEGVELFQFKNKFGNTRWKAQLSFAVKNVTNNFTEYQKNGWNYMLRKDGKGDVTKWDKPKDKDGKYMYSGKDFDALLNEGKLTKGENEFNKFPVK